MSKVHLAEALIVSFVHFSLTNEECTLATMTLRHGDWPVDLDPPFRGHIFRYTARLDYSMNFFSVDARPVSGCEISHKPPPKTFVQIGGSSEVTLYAKNPETGAKRSYTVTATRLLGSETELKFLTVVGGEMSPIFSATERTYHVRLDLKYDIARVIYRLKDNEQRIRSSAQEEGPSAGSLLTSQASKKERGSKNATKKDEDSSDQKGTERRLEHYENYSKLSSFLKAPSRQLAVSVAEPLRTSGETQFRDAYESFMIDVGFQRTIILAVQCADATQANIGAYTLIVHRPGCSPERPYFEPQKRQCVNFCPAGFYRNKETHRCSKCNTNCKVCDSLLHCQMCVPDTAVYTYMVQPDGRCQATVNHLFKKYRWWCIGLAVLLGFLLLIGCIGICQFLGTCGHTAEKRGRKVHSYQSDEEDEEGPPYGARRRLAAY